MNGEHGEEEDSGILLSYRKKLRKNILGFRRRGCTARVTGLLTKDLPERVLESPAEFLRQSVASPQYRQRARMVACLSVASTEPCVRCRYPTSKPTSTCRLPVWISVDSFPGKGQLHIPLQGGVPLMLGHMRARPTLKVRVMVHNTGYPSLQQAAGTMCYLANMKRADHRTVHLPADGKGNLPDSFLTTSILKRDPPVALSMSTFYDAPRPELWAPAHTRAE